MPATTPSVTPPKLEFKAYSEDKDFRGEGKPKLCSRFQTVIYHLHDKKWWIKVTWKSTMSSSCHNAEPGQIKPKCERRKEFQNFVTMIDFQSLSPLDDTVTEIILNEDMKTIDPENLRLQPTKFFKDMPFYTREDPLRVKYPPLLQFPSFRAVNITELIHDIEIADGVFRVFHKGDRTPYILKVVNRPLYHPRDTEVIQQELENLAHFRGVSGIVQPAGVAVFTNPYTTSQESNPQSVINGILLEYHSGGSLQFILKEGIVSDCGWEQWAVQIGDALDTMHRAQKTHMDLKPSNIVLDKDGNAVLIDISGIGGVTREWQSPEILHEMSPFDLPFQTRRLNDIWAYGKILKEIASNVEDSSFTETLNLVADHHTRDVSCRWTLSEAISRLKISSCQVDPLS
ncbi:uncharacterized protein N7459_006927 [Penicillium hispanicum]|uniref:uncharacterized protein n=1 Tax=Penicillium hispanicum TaxID=1080232 RepID=UPI00254027EA|nr:uncharacterized protein N7459_006927 [Penicillium hispanicum]KAJ5577963.1 hypothetical protein N7459_006927 [Penicillium hispanicum]